VNSMGRVDIQDLVKALVNTIRVEQDCQSVVSELLYDRHRTDFNRASTCSGGRCGATQNHT